MKIELHNASKRFKKTVALDGIDFETNPGEIVAILGLNGAGKSTLLRALNGLLKLDRGELHYDSAPFNRKNLELRRRVLFVPDRPVLHPSFSILRNVGIYLRQYERHEDPDIIERVAELFEAFDLTDKADDSTHSLSRGQRYKAGLIALVVVSPDVWLLDEPFASGMDAHGIARFREAARSAREQGATIVYTTQLPELAEGFCDRIYAMTNGAAHEFETVEALRAASHPDLEGLLK